MKIVEIINSLDSIGGAEIFFASLVCEMKSKKCNLEVITLYDKVDDEISYRFKKHGIIIKSCKKRNRFDIFAAKKLKKLILDINPDVINFHLSCLPTYFFAFGFKKRKWKLVETIHSIPGKFLSKFNEKIRIKFIKHRNISFVGISDTISRMMENKYKCSLKTIYNGIYLPILNKDKANKIYDFICVANFREVKNHKLLIECFYKLYKKVSSIKLLCVGDGDLFNETKLYSKKLGIDKNIIFTGKTNDVFQYLTKSKFFVLSSNYEGNPISLLEAISVGLVPIVPAVGGIPDIINKSNGFLYKVGSIDDLYNKMSICLSLKTDEYLKLSHVNLDVAKKYSISTCVNLYIEYFKEIIEEEKCTTTQQI